MKQASEEDDTLILNSILKSVTGQLCIQKGETVSTTRDSSET